jgi:hypothetical protein
MGSRSASVPAKRNAIAEMVENPDAACRRQCPAFVKGTVRSISFFLIRMMAASPQSRPFGSARQL